MADSTPENWMLSDALSLLARAEAMHRRFFQLGPRAPAEPCWEPPMDLIETEREIVAFVALPGVSPEDVEVTAGAGQLVLRGRRLPPIELRHAAIRRLELPQGCFERRVPLPPGRYEVRRSSGHGCLVLRLIKEDRG